MTSPTAYSQSVPGDAERVVHRHVLAGLEAGRVQPDVGRAGRASDRDEELVRLERAAALQLERDDAVPRDRRDARLEPQVDAVLAKRVGDLLARERLFALDQPIAAVDERHLRAQGRPRLRHLDADDAAAEDREPAGNLLRGRRLDVRPRSRLGEARHRRDRRCAARRDDDRLPRDERLVSDRHATLAVEPAVSADEGDTAVGQPGHHRRVVEVVDDLVAAREHRRDVELVADAHALHPRRLRPDLDRPEQCLRGHAGVERALAADQPLLDDRDGYARLAEPPRDHLARCPGADHDHVELALRHLRLLSHFSLRWRRSRRLRRGRRSRRPCGRRHGRARAAPRPLPADRSR